MPLSWVHEAYILNSSPHLTSHIPYTHWRKNIEKHWWKSPCRLEGTILFLVFISLIILLRFWRKLEANVLQFQWLFFFVFPRGGWKRQCVDLISIWFFLNPFACREEQLVVGNLALGNYQVTERDKQQLLQRQLLWVWAKESPGKQLGSPFPSK